MKKCFRKKILSVFLSFLFVGLSFTTAQAVVPVTDTQSTFKTIKQWFTEVKESETVVGTMQTIQKTNAAIGTAKKSVSEYVISNKEKLEEKIAKVQEYKKKAEEYKKEYDQYKKQLDENIAKAKELKEQAEAGIETAKETVEGTKETVEGAIDNAKEKAGISSADEYTEDTAPAEETTATSAIKEQTTATAEEAATNNGEAQNTQIFEATPTSSRTPFESEKANTNIDMVKNDSSVTLAEDAQKTSISQNQDESADELKENELITSKATAVTEVKDFKLQEKTTIDSANTKEIKETLPTAITKPSVTIPTERIQLRKAFTTSSLHQSEKLMFAKVEMLNLPDGGTDSNGVVIIPKALAMYCGLSSGDALEAGQVDNCLLNLNKERKSAQLFSGSDAPKVYNQAMAQYVAASIAEAYKARQDADSFEENFIDAIDFASEPTAQDVYDNIVELNKAIDMQMNGLLKVLSSQLMIQSLYNYGSYYFIPAKKEGEEDE